MDMPIKFTMRIEKFRAYQQSMNMRFPMSFGCDMEKIKKAAEALKQHQLGAVDFSKVIRKVREIEIHEQQMDCSLADIIASNLDDAPHNRKYVRQINKGCKGFSHPHFHP
jgi:hypothetical protein